MTIAFLHTDRDVTLEQKIVSSLKKRDASACRRIAVDVQDGVVRLRGKVKSFYTRQVFVQVCLRTPGVVAVNDEICVGG